MSVILLILKIIGILLLALLGLLLFVILLVLFVPVRYRITGEVEDEISVHLSVTWLLHLITWRGAYEQGEFDSGLRIFGIRLKGKKKSALDESDEEGEPEHEMEAAEDECEAAEQPSAITMGNAEEAAEQPSAIMMGNVEEAAEKPPMLPRGNVEEAAEKPPMLTRGNGEEGLKKSQPLTTGEAAHEVSVAEEFADSAGDGEIDDVTASAGKHRSGVFQKIQNFFSSIKSRFFAIKKALPQIKEKISDIKSILVDENNKIVAACIFGELKYLLEHFKFRKIDTQLRFSLGDPAATGQVLGILCMMPFLYQYQFHLYPDFEADELYIRGTFDIAGRARGVHGLVSLIRMIKKKEVRTLIKKLINR